MSDLVRGVVTTPPASKPAPPSAAPAPPASAPAPPASAPPRLPPPRRSSLYTSVRAGDAPVAPARPEPAPPAEAPPAAERILDDLRTFLERVPDLLKSTEPFPWPALTRVIEAVAGSLQAGGELFWLANGATLAKGADHLAFHQARVTVLAVRIGMTIGYEREHLVELGAAAALSGIALWLLPSGVLRRVDSLSGEDQAQYHAHPRVAAERLRRWACPFEGLVQTVLQHQEREQGQGFPQGLRGAAIRLEAKIVGLADHYVTLIAPFSLRPGLRPHEAVREIVRGKQEAFPAVLVKALLSDVTVFPPGTIVRLNTGEIGTVVAVNRNHPLRPRVEVVSGKSGPLATPKLVDLSEAPFLYITGPMTETAR